LPIVNLIWENPKFLFFSKELIAIFEKNRNAEKKNKADFSAK